MRSTSGWESARSLLWAACLVLGCLALAGCPARLPPEAAPTAASAKPLRLWVVGQPEVAEAIEREWASRSGDQLAVARVPADEFLQRKPLAADAVIFPAAALPVLAERELLLPLDDALAAAPDFNRSDLSPLARDRRGVWGRKTLALSFGEAPLVLVYNRQALESLGAAPPQTWDELHAIFAQYPPQDGSGLPPLGLVQPTAPGWNARLLLARGAAYLAHRESSRSLIDPQSLRPLINTPPLVRALEQICLELPDAGSSKAEAQLRTPEDCFWLVARGQAAAGIARLPRNSDGDNPPLAAQALAQLGLAELPGSAEVYNPRTAAWEPRPRGEDSRVAVLGPDGLLGGVTTASPQPRAAQQLLVWLSSSPISSRVFPRASAAGPFRRSHADEISRWLPADEKWAPLGSAYAEVAWQAESHVATLSFPFGSISADLMSSLDRAVLSAIQKEAAPAAALDSCAQDWAQSISQQPAESFRRMISQGTGLEAQR